MTMTMKMTQLRKKKLLVWVAKDVKTEICAGSSLQEKDVTESATSWLVSFFRRLGYDSCAGTTLHGMLVVDIWR